MALVLLAVFVVALVCLVLALTLAVAVGADLPLVWCLPERRHSASTRGAGARSARGGSSPLPAARCPLQMRPETTPAARRRGITEWF